MEKVLVLEKAAQEILNGKMEECHNAYWEFVPTVDHIYPVALGGADSEENWASTSMLHNSIKNNWTLEQLQWELYEAGISFC